MNKERMTNFTIVFILLSLLISIIIIIGCLIEGFSKNNEESSLSDEELFVLEETSLTENIKNENKKIFNITVEERELIAKLVSCEAGICSDECKRAVVSVVFNRLKSGKWGTSISEVINYPCAFTPVLTGKINSETADESCYGAVDYILTFGCTIPEEVRYFRDDYDFNWDGYKNYTVINNMYFGYFENWRDGEW